MSLLMGVTSVTDANARVTYYDYDDFGWLQFLKDLYVNVLKQYTYHYQAK